MKIRSVFAALLLLLAPIAFCNWQGDLAKGGIISDGDNVTIPGSLSVTGTLSTGTWDSEITSLILSGALDVTGGVALRDAVDIVGAATLSGDVHAKSLHTTSTLEVDSTSLLTGAVTAISTLTVHGASTLNGDVTTTGTATAADLAATDDLTVGDDAAVTGDLGVTGTFSVTGQVTRAGLIKVTDRNTTTSALAMQAADCGGLFVCTNITGNDESNDIVTFNLPSAAAGLYFYFSDCDADENNDLWITAASGDTINGGTAGKSYKCAGDAVKQSLILMAIDSTQWIVINEEGTWANDNS